jgi:hypothetical protein
MAATSLHHSIAGGRAAQIRRLHMFLMRAREALNSGLLGFVVCAAPVAAVSFTQTTPETSVAEHPLVKEIT